MSDGNNILIKFFCSLAVYAVVASCYKFIDQNGGRESKFHAMYLAFAICAIVLVPESIAAYIYTDLTVTLVGAIYPVYRATKAACTPFEGDDKEWLQYWMLGGVLFMATTWVDEVIQEDRGDQIWRGSLLFAFFWLYFPLTCGALLIYEYITAPYLGPFFQPLQRKMSDHIIFLYQTMANATHLYFLWIFFLVLPTGAKRAIAIAVGTVYPCISSITATATEEIDDDTYWLTYWAVYGLLFLLMDLLETWLGWIPGFYSLMISLTVYLMLPMFRGAEKVFRNFLVPLTGLEEMLILRDSIQIKKQMLKNLHPERAKLVRQSIAKFFDSDGVDADPAVLNKELKNSWSALKVSNMSFFGKSSNGKPSNRKSSNDEALPPYNPAYNINLV